MNKEKNGLVVKSNRLVEASYRLDLVEQRIILAAIVVARETQKGLGDDYIILEARRFAALFGMEDGSVYGQLKEAMETLFHRFVIIRDIDTDSGHPRVTKVRWITSSSYIDGAGAVQIRFTPEMVPYIARLEREFTAYRLEKIGKLSSVYAVRLYELLVQYLSIGHREFELAWLRKTLALDSEYTALCDFKKRVINVAVAQINAHSDLTARYDQRKTGRNVTHLIFTFSLKEETKQEQAGPKDAPANIHDSALFQRLRSHGIGAKLAAAWIQQDQASALATVEYVEARAQKGQIKGSTAGYLRTLFEGGAEVGPSAFEAGLAAQARESADAARCAEAEKRAKAKADREAKDRVKATVQALPPAARLALAAEYRQGDGAALSVSWDAGKGNFRDALERIQFNVWLQKKAAG